MTLETITPGQRAYLDYFVQRDGRNSQGGAMPAWADLSGDMRAWWESTGVMPPGSPPWWMNKVYWMNAVVLCMAAAESQVGVLKDVMPGSVFAYVAFGLPVLNKAINAYQLFKAAKS